MFHDFRKPPVATLVPTNGPTALHIVVQEHQEDLINAAGLLAGRRGVRLVVDLTEALSRGAGVERVTLNRASELLDIFALEHVHDPEREEAARFASIDPADPRVDEICALTDVLRRALDQAAPDHPPVLRSRPAA